RNGASYAASPDLPAGEKEPGRESGVKPARRRRGSEELHVDDPEPAPVNARDLRGRLRGDELTPRPRGRLPQGQERIHLVAAEPGLPDEARAEPDVPALVTQHELHSPADAGKSRGQPLERAEHRILP